MVSILKLMELWNKADKKPTYMLNFMLLYTFKNIPKTFPIFPTLPNHSKKTSKKSNKTVYKTTPRMRNENKSRPKLTYVLLKTIRCFT